MALAGSHSRSDPASPVRRIVNGYFPGDQSTTYFPQALRLHLQRGAFLLAKQKGGTFPDKQLQLRLSYEVGLPRPLPFTRYHLGIPQVFILSGHKWRGIRIGSDLVDRDSFGVWTFVYIALELIP